MAEIFTGFAWGVVMDTADPLNDGRVRVQVPGIFEPYHPEWVLPVAWPGSGHPRFGAKYPITVGTTVALFFEHGDISASPLCLTGPYGAFKGTYAGPATIRQRLADGKDPNKVAVIWEDDSFAITVTMDTVAEDGVDDRKVSIVEKTTGSRIELNATDGAQKKSVSITLQANTGINIESNGIIDISGSVVQIQGRRVMKKPGNTTI